MTLNRDEIQEKLDLVINKLMHLGEPENGEALQDAGEERGFFRRDFGITEWDWPQGVGLYGLFKIMQLTGREDYRDFLHDLLSYIQMCAFSSYSAFFLWH